MSTHEQETVFVAGGTGTAGRAYAEAFATQGYPVRATARNQSGADALSERGIVPVGVDLADGEATGEAMDGVDVAIVALLGRGEEAVAEEEVITRNLFDAAARVGVRHLIYTSVHTADRLTGVPHFEVKGRLENFLADVAVPATVLRPCTFMDALTAPWIRDGLVNDGVLASPIALDAAISYVATADLAAVSVKALELRLVGQTIALGGPNAVTYRSLLPKLSKLVGRSIRYQQVPLEMVEAQFGSDIAAMIGLFNEQGFAVDADAVVAELGVELTSVDDFLREASFVTTTAVGAE